MESKMITTDKCELCKAGSVLTGNPVKVHCTIKNKDYYFGQRIPCDEYRKGDTYNEHQS